MSTELRFRQIHLDFHTSEHISGIGSEFHPEAYADTLAQAHVDSVTTFARCHHGYIYSDTQAHPERRHPHLTRNPLADQTEACHRRDIRVPIYTTVQWDHY
ncbi:MAG: beta-galactosidase, partial [Gemmatimonadota bacterium]